VHLPALLAEGSAANRALFAFRPRRDPTQPSRRGPLRVRLLRIWMADDSQAAECIRRGDRWVNRSRLHRGRGRTFEDRNLDPNPEKACLLRR
jgi:hypothetical protein